MAEALKCPKPQNVPSIRCPNSKTFQLQDNSSLKSSQHKMSQIQMSKDSKRPKPQNVLNPKHPEPQKVPEPKCSKPQNIPNTLYVMTIFFNETIQKMLLSLCIYNCYKIFQIVIY